MSQASKVLKEIAASPEYIALAQAIEKSEYEAIATGYAQLSKLIFEKKQEILKKIDSLTRQNLEEDRQQFLTAFNMRLGSTLPQVAHLNKLIAELKIDEGEVFSIGAKGDPMVKSPEGKPVIVTGVKAEKGSRIKYRISGTSPKTDFATAAELNADFFYSLLNRNLLGRIQTAFDTVEAAVKPGAAEINREALNKLLAELQQAGEVAASLKSTEKDRAEAKILAYRKRLLGDIGTRIALDFIAGQEEREITTACAASTADLTSALAAPGLFRRATYLALKNRLYAGGRLKGYEAKLATLESDLNSMDAAMKLEEFKSSFADVEKPAREYLDKMDRLFKSLNDKARYIVLTIAEEKITDVNEIQQKIEKAFSAKSLYIELKREFRSPNEFFTLRESLTRLRTMLGEENCLAAESVIRPYLKQVISEAFERRPAPARVA